jgi:hypothetical protein
MSVFLLLPLLLVLVAVQLLLLLLLLLLPLPVAGMTMPPHGASPSATSLRMLLDRVATPAHQ